MSSGLFSEAESPLLREGPTAVCSVALGRQAGQAHAAASLPLLTLVPRAPLARNGLQASS